MKLGWFGADLELRALHALADRDGDPAVRTPGGAADLTFSGAPRTAYDSMIGVELGDSFVRAAVVEGGAVKRAHVLPFSANARPDEVIALLAAAVQELDATPAATGVAIPGELDESGRCWGIPAVPGFDGVYIAEELAARLACPVSIESDGLSAALGERLHGHGKGHKSALTVVLGQRLSAGLVLGGELRRGSSGFSSEIGHLQIDPTADARLCECGRRGCLAQYASLRALELEYERGAGQRLAAAAVVEHAAAGEAQALQALGALTRSLGAGIALVQNMLDLDAVILVCQDQHLFRLLEPTLRERLRELVFGPSASEVPLFASLLGPDAVIVGAADLAAQIARPGA